jgi:hypothetical protein
MKNQLRDSINYSNAASKGIYAFTLAGAGIFVKDFLLFEIVSGNNYMFLSHTGLGSCELPRYRCTSRNKGDPRNAGRAGCFSKGRWRLMATGCRAVKKMRFFFD